MRRPVTRRGRHLWNWNLRWSVGGRASRWRAARWHAWPL